MSELPRGWAAASLKSITTKIGSGATPRGGKESYHSSGIPLIRSMNIHFEGVNEDGLAYLDQDQAEALSNVIVQPDDVLLNITGASIGRVATAPAWTENARVNQHVAIIRLNKGVEPHFVCAWLASPDVQSIINAENYGVTRQALTKGMIEEFELPLPPLAEQRRIVAKLDALSAQSRATATALTRIEALITRYKAAVLGVFFDGLVLGHETEDGIAIGEIAASIFDGPFGSNLKSADYSEEGQRVVRLENVGHLEFLGDKRTFIPQEKFESLARHELRPGDIIFSSFIADQIRVCRLPDLGGERAINKADCFCIRVDAEKALGRFVELMLASPASYRSLEKLVHGATRPRINTKQLKGLCVALPPLEEQAEIVDRIEGAFAQIETLARATATARARLGALDRAILARAFKGKLVPQNPNDEPAGELLKRVRENAG